MEMPDIPIFDWFEEPIKESVKHVFAGINTGVEALDLFNRYKNAHIEMLRQQVGSISILGMQNPVDLTELYYPATVYTNIRRRIYAPEWDSLNAPTAKGPAENRLTMAGDIYITGKHRAVILGGPGAGKTTFLKFIALAYSDKAIFSKTKLTKSYLPVYIHLPAFGRANCDLTEWISRNLVVKKGEYATAFYSRLLENGACLILLDSLDEVPTELKNDVIEKIKQFSTLYPKIRIIISCRTADYDPVFDDFSEVELARLNKQAITSIVKVWFKETADKGKKLLALLEHDETISTLTETPLLLSLLCIQFKSDLSLPKRKTQLYRRCVDALLRDWDTTRGFRRDSLYAQLSDDSKEKIFEAVAGKACGASIEYELSEAFVLQTVENEISRFSLNPESAKGILREIESHHGILEKRSVNSYEFSHGTMQEYFAARYFVEKRLELDIVKKHFDSESWHNIIMFAASILDDPSQILEFIVAKSTLDKFQNYPAFGRRLGHLLLLYKCMAMGVSIPLEERLKICRHLVISQYQMLTQLNKDGVLPYAARTQNGVRQKMYYYVKGRPSLDKILRPYRSLMNEIFLSHVKEYADCVVEFAEKLEVSNSELFQRLGIATCLLVPISTTKPEYFLEKMAMYSDLLRRVDNTTHINQFLEESISLVQGELAPKKSN